MTDSITSKLLEGIANAVITVAVEHSPDTVRGVVEKIKGSPQRLAFQRALGEAYVQFRAANHTAAEQYFDGGFLQGAGAPVLARYLIPGGRPDASALAIAFVRSITPKDRPISPHAFREAERPASQFVHALTQAVETQPELRELNDSHALRAIADATTALAQRLDADEVTPGTRIGYLYWVLTENAYLDVKGTATVSATRLPTLPDVYVTLDAAPQNDVRLDRDVARKWLAQREQLEAEGAPTESVENQFEAWLAERGKKLSAEDSGSRKPLTDILRDATQAVILGDPGIGKTTVLRFAAWAHADALLRDEFNAVRSLGRAQFPIFIRIGEYANALDEQQISLSDYVAEYCRVHECPNIGLRGLLEQQLQQGNCLILLDGLDEIAQANDRGKVTNQIEQFVRRHTGGGNRFVLTSRVAGYRAAPLSGDFAHYAVQPMTDPQIDTFLAQWCPAAERYINPERGEAVIQAEAQAQIKGLKEAFNKSKGVMRLARYPLTLRILALTHRNKGRLPDNRALLYEFAAQVLCEEWLNTKSLPDAVLEPLRYDRLKPYLSQLAFWIHTHKNQGLATEREVLAQFGLVWERSEGDVWDAARPNDKLVTRVRGFLRTVREHTGLVLERAPGNFGFMHRTFQEFFAACALIADADPAAGIRERLHDPIWEEPILLALALEARNQRAEILMETAILPTGPNPRFPPSPFEAELERDFLFALRCLQDGIPVTAKFGRMLAERTAQEILYKAGCGKLGSHWNKVSAHLPGWRSTAAQTFLKVMLEALHADAANVRWLAVRGLGQLGNADEPVRRAVIDGLLTALGDADDDVRSSVARSLGQFGNTDERTQRAVIDGLLTALRDADVYVRHCAAQSLGQFGNADESTRRAVIDGLLTALRDNKVRYRAASSLVQFGNIDESARRAVSESLLNALCDTNAYVRQRAAKSLGQLGNVDESIRHAVVDGLLTALHDTDADVRLFAAQSLDQFGNADVGLRLAVINGLLGALCDTDPIVRLAAAWSLGQFSETDESIHRAVIDGLLAALCDTDADVRARASQSLGQFGNTDKDTYRAVIDSLLAALHDTDADVRAAAAQSLVQLGNTDEHVYRVGIDGILAALRESDHGYMRRDAAQWLGKHAPTEQIYGERLFAGLLDADNDVRAACATALAQWAKRSPQHAPALAERLRAALTQPDFATQDNTMTPAYEYVYQSLDQLLTALPRLGSTPNNPDK